MILNLATVWESAPQGTGFPQDLMMISNESNARASAANLWYVPSVVVAPQPETSTQPDPVTDDPLGTSHAVDRPDYMAQEACYLFSWISPLF